MNLKWKKLILYTALFIAIPLLLAPLGRAAAVGIYDGLEIEFTIEHPPVLEKKYTTLTFTQAPGLESKFKAEWVWTTGETGSWYVDKETRLISTRTGDIYPPDESTMHWIHIDVSIGQNVTICNTPKIIETGITGETNFTVMGEALHGEIPVWVLEDVYGSELWYNKEFGFLMNGSMSYAPLQDCVYEYLGTNAYKIPGYSLPIIIALIGITSLVLLRKVKPKKK